MILFAGPTYLVAAVNFLGLQLPETQQNHDLQIFEYGLKAFLFPVIKEE